MIWHINVEPTCVSRLFHPDYDQYAYTGAHAHTGINPYTES